MHRMKDDLIDRHLVEGYQKRSQKENVEAGVGGSQMKMENTEWETEKERSLNIALTTMNSTKMDVAEVYSPERITTLCEEYCIKAGRSLDLTTIDEHGGSWDFDCMQMRNKAVRKFLEDKPMLLTRSPMCTGFGP